MLFLIMFFRFKQLKSGRVTQLIESYRDTEGVPRHHMLVSLGNYSIPARYKRQIERAIESRLRGEQLLFGPDVPAQVSSLIDDVVRRVEAGGRWRDRPRLKRKRIDEADSDCCDAPATVDGVLVDQVTHTDTTQLGVSLLGLHAWRRLGMPGTLERLGFNAAQRNAAAVSVINRLDEPCSENGLPAWVARSSLVDLLGDDVLRGGEDRFYRISDKLLANRDALEEHLRGRQAQVFELQRAILLYDLTNTHFEGACRSNPKAVRGANKQKRNDCPQVVVGMVFDQEGFELAHRTFKGNTNDGRTLLSMVETLRDVAAASDKLPSALKPVVVMDSGIATLANRKLLRAQGFSYLVNDSRPGRKKWQQHFTEDGFELVSGRESKTAVSVRAMDIETEEKDEDGTPTTVKERVVLCRSDGRLQKELAIRSKAEDKLLVDLGKLSERVAAGRLKDPAKIQRAVGRVLQRNPRVGRYYGVQVDPASEDGATRATIRWKRRDDAWSEDGNMFGCYVLRTDRRDLPAYELWQLYMTLCHAEDGFRALKSDLGLRPNYHQLEHRVDAHVFITVLAYQLQHFIRYTLRQTNGDTRSWSTLRRVLQTHCYTTVLMPTVDGNLYRLRRPGRPEAVHEQIYRQFGISTAGLPRSELVTEQQKSTTL